MNKIYKFASLVAVLLIVSPSAYADSSSREWSDSVGFRSESATNTKLLQADLIKKANSGYYDSPTYSNTNNYTGDFYFCDEDCAQNGGTKTNSYGSYTETNIKNENGTVTSNSTSESNGNVDGSINLNAGNDIKMINQSVENQTIDN